MDITAQYLAGVRSTYTQTNAATLRWMLDRPRIGDGFINTKLNPITLHDYGKTDWLRGVDHVYGWIQGRGLEALVTHARAFDASDPELATRLRQAAKQLYTELGALQGADGHVYFCYDSEMSPIRRTKDWQALAQSRPGKIYTFSDAFAAKGLAVAASEFAPADLPGHLAYLGRVISAIEEGRFQIDEHADLSEQNIAAQANDFGPRMILLGAAGMISRFGLDADLGFADRFIAHILENHLDRDTCLVRNVPGEDGCNVGHGIEFVGFALDHAARASSNAPVDLLDRILFASTAAGFDGPGIALSVSLKTGKPDSPYFPWWPLPETIRTAALCYERTTDPVALKIWQRAHDCFFAHYWRGSPPIAYQARTAEGPLDYVPATPDLDPGYHTGLSFLAAAEVAERLSLANGTPHSMDTKDNNRGP
ncbi:MAG: hypothetical protein GXP01_08310 [Alphaproteobacteria bacterium]|nr:hypothetical protein [Alphaproteobacteria bacterium]